jgi:DNA-binding MarR family transcriptional regulator
LSPSPRYRGPLLGALLRLARAEVLEHIAYGFAIKGVAPIQPAVTQPLYERPEGLRLTELAALEGVSKQAMAEGVQAMIAAGYVEQKPDPRDGRARLLRLTPRGRKASDLARELVTQVEERWELAFGRKRIAMLRDLLKEIVEARKATGSDAFSNRGK